MRLISIFTAGVIACFGASCASAQDVPLTPVYPRPAPLEAGSITASYSCYGATVRFEFALNGDRVAVVDYVGQGGKASAEDLARWNAWLGDVERYHHYAFRCGPDYEGLTVWGGTSSANGTTRQVSVDWDRGRLRRRDPVPVRP